MTIKSAFDDILCHITEDMIIRTIPTHYRDVGADFIKCAERTRREVISKLNDGEELFTATDLSHLAAFFNRRAPGVPLGELFVIARLPNDVLEAREFAKDRALDQLKRYNLR